MAIYTGTDGANNFSGGDGNDHIDGKGGADRLSGKDGNDTILGGDGNDWLSGGAGADTIAGGLGTDTVYVSGWDAFGNTDSYDGGLGFDTLEVYGGNIATWTFTNFEYFISYGGVHLKKTQLESFDQIRGEFKLIESGTVSLAGVVVNGWADIYLSNQGNTLALAGIDKKGARFSVFGGRGSDAVNGSSSWDMVSGGYGDDILTGGGGGDNLKGDEGNDILSGGNHDDSLDGGDGEDELAGDAGDDILSGGTGEDSLLGGDGNDQIYLERVELGEVYDGGAGYDTLTVTDTDITQRSFTSLEVIDGHNITLTMAQLDRFEGITVGSLYLADTGTASFSGATIRREAVFHLASGTNTLDFTGAVLEREDWISGVRIHGGSGADAITGTYGIDDIEAGDGDDKVAGGDHFDNLFGNAGDDTLSGGEGADDLYGGSGTDSLHGNGGNDTLHLDDQTGMVGETFDGGEGTDLLYILAGEGKIDITGVNLISIEQLQSGYDSNLWLRPGQLEGLDLVDVKSVTFTEGGTVSLAGDAIAIEEYFLAAVDTVLDLTGINGRYLNAVCVTGNSRSDHVLSGEHDFTFFGAGGDDILDGSRGTGMLSGGEGNDRLIGGRGSDDLFGGDGDDFIDPGADVYYLDRIDGGAGFDTVSYGGATGGMTLYVSGGGLTSIEGLSGSAHADRLWGNSLANRLEGAGGGDRLEGDGGDDILEGGAGSDRLTGGAGFDILRGGIGNDLYVVDDLSETLFEKNDEGIDTVQASLSYRLGNGFENLTLVGTADADAFGNYLDNVLRGSRGANLLDGRSGADTMCGGGGRDSYVVEDARDIVIETSAIGGTDEVQASVSFVLGANLEKLVLTGTAAIAGTGNGLNNAITGNHAANALDGGAGADRIDGGRSADRMNGGSENDVYIVDDIGDTAVEFAGGGSADRIESNVSYVLGAHVEQLTLRGFGTIAGTGNGLANLILGNAAANALDGKSGGDEMRGGRGNDSYRVDNARDRILEASGAGSDAVISSLSWTLGENLETLTLAGAARIDGKGNRLANHLVGNANDNMLDGAAGADRMEGGAGNDSYRIDHADDAVIETAGAGTDSVVSTVSHRLAAGVEHLSLVGIGRIDGTGNDLANRITGNANHNVIDGREGADRMEGGAGNDVYHVDNAGDAIVEGAGAGSDSVLSAITLTLGANLESLTLAGSRGIDGIGNALANDIGGNGGSNLLDGKAGADRIDGGGGNDNLHGGTDIDKLTGGAGADRFHFDTRLGADNVDTIADFLKADDTIVLDRTIFARISANGTLAASAFHVGGRAADALDRIVYEQATGRIFYDADGNGAGAAVLFARVDAGTVLTNADFFVVA